LGGSKGRVLDRGRLPIVKARMRLQAPGV